MHEQMLNTDEIDPQVSNLTGESLKKLQQTAQPLENLSMAD